MFVNRKMDLKNVQCFIQWGITQMLKTVKLLSKWKEPEKIILSKLLKTQTYKFAIYG